MSDNLQAAFGQDFALTEHSVLALRGRDAVAFGQAQFMNDIALLGDGQWQWNGWLTPKGRVIALFALLKPDAETLWLLLPDADPAALATQLQRYVFRSKVELQTRDDLHVTGAFTAPALASNARFAGDADSVLELDLSAEGGYRRLHIGSAIAATDADARARWRRFDLEHSLPRLRAAQAEQWTPQQLSLDRLRAFSVKKGCYPGQEIVARTHFLGQVKRRLALFEANGRVVEGAPIEAEGQTLGTVIASEGSSVLAVLPLQYPAEGLHAAGIALRPSPLRDGLAR